MTINSIKKGKGYERDIAKKLSKAFGIQFQRVPQSGATATTKNLSSPTFKADVFTEDTSFNYLFFVAIECKKRKKIGILDMINYFYKEGIIYEWVDQCIKQSAPMNFWLIFSSNNMTDFVIEGSRIENMKTYQLSGIMKFDRFLQDKKILWESLLNVGKEKDD